MVLQVPHKLFIEVKIRLAEERTLVIDDGMGGVVGDEGWTAKVGWWIRQKSHLQ